MDVIEFVLKHRSAEIRAGRTPSTIELTKDQKARLENYCNLMSSVSPDRSWLLADGSGKEMIFGLEIIVKEDLEEKGNETMKNYLKPVGEWKD